MLHCTRFNPKQIFLLDGIGALVSSFSLGIVLVSFESYIGMPIHILYLLAGLAIVFAFYSILSYLLFPKNWIPLLRLIAIVNAMYSILTLGLIIHYFQELSHLGLSYFISEIVVLILLVRLEFRAVLGKSN